MSFDVSFQRAILRLAQIDEAFSLRVMQLVDSPFFTTEPLGWCFTMMKRYTDTYGMRCTELVLRDALRHAPVESVPAYAREIDAIAALGNVPEEEYIKKELAEFCKRNMFAIAHKRAADLWNEKKHDDAYRVMNEAHEEMDRVSFAAEDRSFFFEEFDQRQKKRFKDRLHIEASVFTTGIPLLDEATDGGVRLGEVWMILGDAKMGKTTWLCNQGFNIVRVHKEPVLHFQLEGMRWETEAKYDTLFSGEMHTKVRRGEFDSKILRELQAEYARLRGLLVIRALTDWDINILHIDTEFKTLRAQGFRPKGCILDYMDLMRSREKIRDGSETAHQIAATRDFKRFCVREELAGHTASQVQRPKKSAIDRDDDEFVFRARDVADAYAKVRIVDWYGSLNATDAEREKNESRLFAEAHRQHPLNRIYVLHNDFERMKMAKTSAARSRRTPSEDPPGTTTSSSTVTVGGKRRRKHGP